MSVDECGFSCIGLGSTSNIRKIFDYDTSKTVLIIALDNDKDGHRASVALANECDECSVPYIVVESDVWGNYKGANEIFIRIYKGKAHIKLTGAFKTCYNAE